MHNGIKEQKISAKIRAPEALKFSQKVVYRCMGGCRHSSQPLNAHNTVYLGILAKWLTHLTLIAASFLV
jgi:hypothetical protein